VSGQITGKFPLLNNAFLAVDCKFRERFVLKAAAISYY
jgi:hypothetical protein